MFVNKDSRYFEILVDFFLKIGYLALKVNFSLKKEPGESKAGYVKPEEDLGHSESSDLWWPNIKKNQNHNMFFIR